RGNERRGNQKGSRTSRHSFRILRAREELSAGAGGGGRGEESRMAREVSAGELPARGAADGQANQSGGAGGAEPEGPGRAGLLSCAVDCGGLSPGLLAVDDADACDLRRQGYLRAGGRIDGGVQEGVC